MPPHGSQRLALGTPQRPQWAQARRLLQRERQHRTGWLQSYEQTTSFLYCRTHARWFPVEDHLPQTTPCCGEVHLVAMKRRVLDEAGIDYSSTKEPW